MDSKDCLVDLVANSGLSDNDLLLVLAKYMGYKKLPPTIDEFLSNDYYLGKVVGPKLPNGIYPYWIDVLRKIFPNPVVCRYPYISLGGAIGTGKSTISKVITLYNLCKLEHMSDPWRSLGVSRTKDLAFSFIHTSTAVAEREFRQSILSMMSQSPYFAKLLPLKNMGIRLQTEGTRNTTMLGTDLIGAVLSEVNFWKPESVAKDKMDTAMGRFTSRFGKYQHYIGFIIFDTSARGDASVMEKFISANPLEDKFISINASQWEVKGNERGGFFRSGGFWVYAGDSLKSPFILGNDQTVESLTESGMDYDKNRFIYCPNELLPEFKSDIIKALNDKAGYSTHSTGKFFENPEMITDCVKLPKLNEDSIMVDFYDTDDKLSNKLRMAMSRIDPNTPCYIHIDMGYVHDLCGLSLIQFNKWVMYGANKTRYPSFRVPLSVGISRRAGQETSALHIYDFITEIASKYDLASVSYDSHQTRPIVQELMRAGIDTKLISVDKTTEPYIVLKNLMGRGLIELPQNDILLRELAELKYVGPDKIDHPSTGSKDIADSVCGAIFNAYTNIDMASEPSANTFKVKQQAKLFGMVEDRQFNNPIQRMVENLF